MSYGVTLKHHTFHITHSVLARNIDSVDTKHKLPNKNDKYCISIASIFCYNRYNISLQYYQSTVKHTGITYNV